jgi:hypothetical protein
MLTSLELSIRGLAVILATVTLAACTTPDGSTSHTTHHPDQAAGSPAQAGGMIMGGQSSAGMTAGTSTSQTKPEDMDMNQMCTMYRNMQNTPMEQRQTMMDQQMKGMSPEMRQQHMEMMRQQCK